LKAKNALVKSVNYVTVQSVCIPDSIVLLLKGLRFV